MIVNKSLYPVSQSLKSITTMSKQLEQLQLQLSSGKRFNTLSEMGNERVHDLNLRSRLTRIEGYQSNILTVETRMSFYTGSLERLDEIEASARQFAVPNAYGTDGINLLNAKNQATNLLRETIDVLNTDVTGQYIFGGNASDKKPVASFEEIMNGPNGFIQYAADANATDLANMGHINDVRSGTNVSLTEDGVDANGFKLVSVTSSNSTAVGVAATPADPADLSVPRDLDIDFNGQPQAGDTITIGITYPHDRDTVKYVTLTASNKDPLPDGAFKIGATAEETAANFHATVQEKFTELSETTLRSSSTYAAADRFFNGNGQAQDANATPWYNGQSSDNPRQTASANVDEHTKVNFGVQANEKGFVELIKGLAVFAVSDLTPLEETNAARYEQLVDIQRSRLSESNNTEAGSIEGITMELGLAAKTVDTVKERHQQYSAQLENMLADIEEAPIEEVGMQILTMQTRLQASYQVTSMISQLTLVNYLR